MKLEAGKDYYLTQSAFDDGWDSKTFLVRHSKELVMYEVAGSLWSEWTQPAKKDEAKKK